MKEIKVEELQNNPFQMIGKDWMLVTAKKGDQVNTMTASWGTMGILWNKPVMTLYIRPQRYTKEFIDSADTLSLSVLPDAYRKELTYFGRVSGRDEDKIKESGLEVEYDHETPYFKESEVVIIGRKLYCQQLDTNCFIEQEYDEKNYPNKDYSYTYVVEIEKILLK